MSSKSETGHAKNVANFGTLIVTLEGFGEKYKPSKETIKLTVLCNLEAECRQALTAINEAQPEHTRALAERETAVTPIDKLVRRVINALKSTDAPQKTIDAAKALSDKINGTKKKSVKTEEQKQTLAAEGKSTKEISTAQTSFDSRMENFDKLIKLLEKTPEYTPNEEELQPANLAVLRDNAIALNKTVITLTKKMINLRIARDKVLYDKKKGLIVSVGNVRSYLRSVFEIGSKEYKQITNLQFRQPAKI